METNRNPSCHHETAPAAHSKLNAVTSVAPSVTMKDNGSASAGTSNINKIKTKRVVFKNITNATTTNQIILPREMVDSKYCNNIKLLNNSGLQQTLSMRFVLLKLGGWSKCGLGFNKVIEYITNSDGNIGAIGFLIARLDGETGKIVQTDITLTEGRRSTIGDGLYPVGSEKFDTSSGANSLLSNPDYAILNSKCLAYGNGDALKQSNKQFVRTIYQDTYDVSAFLLLISVADATAESKLYRRLAR